MSGTTAKLIREDVLPAFPSGPLGNYEWGCRSGRGATRLMQCVLSAEEERERGAAEITVTHNEATSERHGAAEKSATGNGEDKLKAAAA